MTLKVLIVDDETLARSRLRTLQGECTDPRVDVVGEALFGKRLVQSAATRPLLTRKSMSVVVFIVTTSASSPSLTARAWALEPPWAWSTFTSLPVVFL